MQVRMKRIISIFLIACCAVVYAQDHGQQAAQVRYTEAIEQSVKQMVQLPGYVESPYASALAGEIEGLVIELKAREGDRVEKGQPLVMLQTTPLELRLRAAKAGLEEARARRKMAEKNLQRSKGLIESKTISQQRLDESQYEFDAWQGRIEKLRADIAGIQFDIKRSTIRAPFNGVVVARHTEVGQWSDAGATALEVQAVDTLEIHVDVPEKYFSGLKVGINVAVSFDSLPGMTQEGYVRAVIPRADGQAHTFPVKIRLGDPNESIGAGMLAMASFPIGQVGPGVLVPKDAIVRQGPVTVIYVINGDNAVTPVPVTAIAAAGQWSVVSGEVTAGAKVITRGNERLQPGQPVRGAVIEYPIP